MDKDKVLWLITARSGSKGVPDKNIKLLKGIPLIGYSIKALLTFADPENVWVSTDSAHYAEVAKAMGAEVPFLRPAELASDSAKSVDVVLHAMNWAENLGRSYKAIGLVQPTSPFLKPGHILEAVSNLFEDKDAQSIVSVRESSPSAYFAQEKAKYLTITSERIRNQGILRRQDVKTLITPSGGFYIAKWDEFKANKTFYFNKTLAYIIPELHAIDIDEPLDWLWAEFLLEKKFIDVTQLWKLD